MKRLLIFLLLFPAIAGAAFFAVLYVLTGAEPDSLSGTGFAYLLFVAPALLLAVVDWLFAKAPIPAVVGTTLFGYAAAVLSATMLWHRGLDEATLTAGLVGAIPAAVCSWLSKRASVPRTIEP
jgi:hypothetical protein